LVVEVAVVWAARGAAKAVTWATAQAGSWDGGVVGKEGSGEGTAWVVKRPTERQDDTVVAVLGVASVEL
jgi:hypothetical protein